MDLKAWNQKLVTKVTDLENEKAELQSELEQMQLLNKFKNTDFIKERDELQGEISELQLLVEEKKAIGESLLWRTFLNYGMNALFILLRLGDLA